MSEFTYSNMKRTLYVLDRNHDFEGSVDVTDPCYNRDVWCRINDLKLAPGGYACVAERIEYDVLDEYDDGEKHNYHESRISRIGIVNTMLIPELENEETIYPVVSEKIFPSDSGFVGKYQVEYIDTIGVDAGLAGFFHEKKDFSDEEWSGFCGKLSMTSDPYITDDGFFSSSGYGDGSYPLYGVADPDDENRWTALFLEFIGDEDDCDDED